MDGRPRVADGAPVDPPTARDGRDEGRVPRTARRPRPTPRPSPGPRPTTPTAPAPLASPTPVPPPPPAVSSPATSGPVRPPGGPGPAGPAGNPDTGPTGVAGFPTPGPPPPALARHTGRHALPERRGTDHTPPHGYRPRHAVTDAPTQQIGPLPLPGTTEVTAVTAATDVTAAPDVSVATDITAATDVAAVPEVVPAAHVQPVPVAAATPEAAAKKPLYGAGPIDPDAPVPDRVRVVLAERRAPTRAVRTVAEIEQQTETGEFLLDNLMRAQFALAVRLGLVATLVLGVLPVLLLAAPALTDVSVAGIGLPWLLLGVLPFPFLFGLGWLATHHAERNERDFAENVED